MMETNSANDDGYDANLMEAMGFGTFGAQGHRKSKKRRMNPEETNASDSARGSNAMPLGKPRRAERQTHMESGQEGQLSLSPPKDNKELQVHQRTETSLEHVDKSSAPVTSFPSSHAFAKLGRHAVTYTLNGAADHDGGQLSSAYYSPRFVENPWEELERVLEERDRSMVLGST